MMYKVREANLQDYEKLMPIHKEVHDLHVKGRPDKYHSTPSTLDLNYFKSLVEDDHSKVYIVESNEKIIAFTFLRVVQTPDRETSVKNKYVFMEDLGVLVNYQGQGLGKMLFNQALMYTKAAGAKSLELGVWEFNEQAINFYEAMGMRTQARKMEIIIE